MTITKAGHDAYYSHHGFSYSDMAKYRCRECEHSPSWHLPAQGFPPGCNHPHCSCKVEFPIPPDDMKLEQEP